MDIHTLVPFHCSMKIDMYRINVAYILTEKVNMLTIEFIFELDDINQKYYAEFTKEYVESTYNMSFYNFLTIIKIKITEQKLKLSYNNENAEIIFSYDNNVKFDFSVTLPRMKPIEDVNSEITTLKNDLNFLKEVVNCMNNDLERMKERELIIIGKYLYPVMSMSYSELPLIFCNPNKECDIQITHNANKITTLSTWSSKREITVNSNFCEFTDSFKDVNCHMLIINTNYNFNNSKLWNYLPLLLKIIEFKDGNTFDHFLKDYKNTCKNLYRIILRDVIFIGTNISRLIEFDIKDLIIIGGNVINIEEIDKVINVVRY